MRYFFLLLSLVILSFFVVRNADVITQTFFPREAFVAQISLGGGGTGDERKIIFDETEKTEPVFCSVISPREVAGFPGPVLINEVAWMGDAESFSNEWVELKNVSGASVNLAGWQLLDKDSQLKIIFSGREIGSSEIILLQRSRDFSGNLRNRDEKLFLFDDACGLVDVAEAAPDWPAGDNKQKLTMERSEKDFSWHNSSVVGGTPGVENSLPPSEPAEVGKNSPADLSVDIASSKININTAGFDELQKITGVGPVIAGRIIEYREANGPFGKLEDLQSVKGIGEANFLKMSAEISL